VGEKCPDILPKCREATTWDRRLYFPSEGRRAEDFFFLALKIRRLRPGANPRTSVPFFEFASSLSFSSTISIFKAYISHANLRLKEAQKLGFKKAIMPKNGNYSSHNIEIIKLVYIKELRGIFNHS
jgi:hypothetical protein